MSGRMHDDEIDVPEQLVRRLIGEQFPELATLPVAKVESTGTVNAIYRIGDRLCGRFPRVAKWAGDVANEVKWLPRLAGRVSLRVPKPVVIGRPTPDYPCPWAVYEWIEGAPYADHLVDDEHQAAKDLAGFVLELRRMDTTGAKAAGRAPLHELDTVTRAAIVEGHGVIDVDASLAAWRRALRAPVHVGDPVWIHGDLLRPNLLVRDGRLHAVIDFGSVGVGDPAADVTAAWAVLGMSTRGTFRAALNVDDGTWERARGFALHQAALLVPYYRQTNPGLVLQAGRTIAEILCELENR